MPWDGVTFKLNLLGPFEDFYNSLLATPGSDGLANATPEIPTLTEVTQSFQNLAAGMVIAFDPYVEGSPACAALCQLPEWETELSIVKDIEAIDPNNTSLQGWINEYPFNNANLEETQLSVAMLQTGSENLTASNLTAYDTLLASINPELPYLFTNEGYITDPAYLAYVADPTGTLAPDVRRRQRHLGFGRPVYVVHQQRVEPHAAERHQTSRYFLDPTSGNPPLGAASDLGLGCCVCCLCCVCCVCFCCSYAVGGSQCAAGQPRSNGWFRYLGTAVRRDDLPALGRFRQLRPAVSSGPDRSSATNCRPFTATVKGRQFAESVLSAWCFGLLGCAVELRF